jgi:hypothetical protein
MRQEGCFKRSLMSNCYTNVTVEIAFGVRLFGKSSVPHDILYINIILPFVLREREDQSFSIKKRRVGLNNVYA